MKLPLGLLVFACFAQTGCNVVTVNSPKQGPQSDCLDTISVSFYEHFQPGTFKATLGASDIAPQFSPAPAPSGTSTAPIIPDVPPIFRLPNRKGVVLNQPTNDYFLTVGGQCAGATFYCNPETHIEFQLNSFSLDHGVDVKLPDSFYPNEPGFIIGNLNPAYKVTKDTLVELRPSNDTIRIDEMAPGVPKTETIFAKVGFIPYRISGVHTGTFTLTVAPPTGCLTTVYNGTVSLR